jgi:hypothetical protein
VTTSTGRWSASPTAETIRASAALSKQTAERLP